MKIDIQEKFKVITPDEGMILYDGEYYHEVVYAPLDDNLDGWSEIPVEEINNNQN